MSSNKKLNKMDNSKYVFVTVGSTSFDDLISHVHSPSVLQLLQSQGYSRIVYQIGQGKYIPTSESVPNKSIKIEHFTTKDSIENYLRNASLVICHAGVGTVMESLRLKRQVVVVVNSSLMDDHQLEVAEALESSGHVYLCPVPNQIEQILSDIPSNSKLIPISKLDTTLFPTLINEELSMVSESDWKGVVTVTFVALLIATFFWT